MAKLLPLFSIVGMCVLTELTTAMFFTNSKENDYPRIGKRPVSFLSKRRKTWERNSQADFPELTQRMADDIDNMLNFRASEELFLRSEEPERRYDYQDFIETYWPKYRESERLINRNKK